MSKRFCRKILSVFPLLFFLSSFSHAQTIKNETITISSYYPSPGGIYGVLNLYPKEQEPQDGSPGDMYFNKIDETLMYFKNDLDRWQELVGSSGGSGGGGGGSGIWNETASHNIYTTNLGQTLIQGKPDANGVLMEVRGRFCLLDPSGNNIFHMDRKFDAAGSYQNVISFNTQDRIDYQIQHLGNPPMLRIIQAPVPGAPVLAIKEDRIGIGMQDPIGPLQVETSALTSPLIVKTGTDSSYSSGIVSLAPYLDRLYLTFGCYLKNNNWIHDPFVYMGAENRYNAKFCIDIRQGALWFASDTKSCSWNLTNFTHVHLWDETGTWVGACAPSSSRSLKENFMQLDPDDILAKIDQLEVSRWNYKKENISITHIGPVAEDFSRLFKTGSSENELHLIDSVGVSLAGVKALSEKANQQQQLIQELQAQIEELKLQLKKRQNRHE